MKKLRLNEIAAMSTGETMLVTTTQVVEGIPPMMGRPCMLTPIQTADSVNVVTWQTAGSLAGAGGINIELPKALYGTAWYAEAVVALASPAPAQAKVVRLICEDGSALDTLFVENFDDGFMAALEAAETAWGATDEEFNAYVTEALTNGGYRLRFAEPDEVATYRCIIF